MPTRGRDDTLERPGVATGYLVTIILKKENNKKNYKINKIPALLTFCPGVAIIVI